MPRAVRICLGLVYAITCIVSTSPRAQLLRPFRLDADVVSQLPIARARAVDAAQRECPRTLFPRGQVDKRTRSKP